MVGVVGGVEKQLRQRIGVVGVDRSVDGVAVPRLGWLTSKHGVGIRLLEGFPDGRFPAAVKPL